MKKQSTSEGYFQPQDRPAFLSTRQGHPVYGNQNLRTVGHRGPATLEHDQFLEKISHFDRERVPERVVHARGAGTHGVFESYGTAGDAPIAKYTRAKFLQEKGKTTPLFVRFSTVIHGTHSPETLRDPRGFAVKMYNEEGNWDLVRNNLKIFFISDAIKFPDFIHAFKPDPLTNIQDPQRQFDFVSQSSETLPMITFLFSPWGKTERYRHMQGAGVNTYKWMNSEGEAVLVKYRWEPLQGIKNLTTSQAQKIQGKNFNHATQDLYEAIEKGAYREWELFVQLMPDHDHPELDFDPLDDTKVWPNDQFPWFPIGKMTLTRNPENYFAEVEQAAFGMGVLVDGLDFSDDKMLQGRTFSYADTQRYRVGTNYLQLPINRPHSSVATNQRDGQMAYHLDVAEDANPHVNYEPSWLCGVQEGLHTGKDHTPLYQARLVREAIDRQNNFKQAGETYRNLQPWERDELILNLTDSLSRCHSQTQNRMIDLFAQCDEDYGDAVAKGLHAAAETKEKSTGATEDGDRVVDQAEEDVRSARINSI